MCAPQISTVYRADLSVRKNTTRTKYVQLVRKKFFEHVSKQLAPIIFSPSRHLINDTQKFLTVENLHVENLYQIQRRGTDVNLYRNYTTTLRIYKKLSNAQKNLKLFYVEQPFKADSFYLFRVYNNRFGQQLLPFNSSIVYKDSGLFIPSTSNTKCQYEYKYQVYGSTS